MYVYEWKDVNYLFKETLLCSWRITAEVAYCCTDICIIKQIDAYFLMLAWNPAFRCKTKHFSKR